MLTHGGDVCEVGWARWGTGFAAPLPETSTEGRSGTCPTRYHRSQRSRLSRLDGLGAGCKARPILLLFARMPPPRTGSVRRWLAWLAIPLATSITLLAESMKRDRSLDGDGKGILILFGMVAGAACIVWSTPRDRGSRWVYLGFYPFVMLVIFIAIDFLFNGIERLF
jgi:hypothetical protein